MFKQKFAFSLVVFVHIPQFQFDFYCFFDFLDQIFFLNCFPNPFIVHSRPRFFFLTSGFLITFGVLTLIFSFTFF